MILKVEIDLEDLTQDLFEDERWSLKEGVISSIRHDVVAEIKKNCDEYLLDWFLSGWFDEPLKSKE